MPPAGRAELLRSGPHPDGSEKLLSDVVLEH